MNAEAIRDMLRRQPFIPLEVQLSSGIAYTIDHPEFALVQKTRMIIGFPETDREVVCSLIHVCRIREFDPSGMSAL